MHSISITMSVGFSMFLCFALVTITYSRNTRIIEGSYADINDYSFYASVRRISDNLLLCGGAIITNKHILTAAHCFPDLLYAYVNSKIITGTSNITANPGNTHLPKKIYVHPGFTSEINEQKFMYNDVAVIKLQTVIVFNAYQSQILLPQYNIKQGDITILTGMGSLTYPMLTASTELKKVWMKVSDPLACRPAIPFHIRVDQFCAYQRISVGPCIGDGGSPLININTIVGIVSIFRPCATGFPDIYTNVYMHTQFIKQSAELEDL